ncbi:dihydrolipoamide acetyltransferase family protein [Flavobacterium johnsoniae]|uniref:Dihydrolipoamide acetyltransferase component of pyruvate dehydrogenase complex n=1 Tax=Flavobacterium johnsoniae (strain ATCC 17061 / DSM 2064 / JCM 8514 / BCRC 14874 / CCUG 350202 / NBRC 14942 / NCIMB 11054 / UW101) TaxID=376686 RepID=A5F9X8_FLAJ1|nr:dihydrolipoamide acetyltransferase family protein [Flavobacterium johnsoniae]ABQ07987.1 catalytic domain of components of various dehydrogenase complexes [Flavobacterium johnsoniae UW101]OXG02065.1 diapophytoene dehydrogenase [Flavobacterium johnsoniae UW101]WQG80167.1 dihydrolipoamide acetyltransferase family protein [Flavobacterium johnsoniae UW101]SHK95483.1 2-oxoglutarate dehydrogenase E2 component (dihydrolipoamide succinyltransferase) [Flavobacterium johnsoniae]
MARFELKLPKMGESVAEATITNWLKEVGDKIEADEAVLEIATDKVDSEVPSEVSGILVEQLFGKDDLVQVGQTIAIIETEGGDAPAVTPVVEVSVPAEAVEIEKTIEAVKETVTAPQDFAGSDKFFSPLVKNIAKEEGISVAELDSIQGSGKDGRVTKDDIFKYIEDRKSGVVQAPKAVEEAPKAVVETPKAVVETPKAEPVAQKSQQAVPVSVNGGDEIVEMDRMRKLISGYMTASVQTSAHVQSFIEVDVTNIVKWRDKVKTAFEKREGEKLTFTPIMMEAVAKALKDFPGMNISVDGDYIIKKKNINLGMAAALPNGNLIVPVIKNADQLNLVGMAKAVNDLGNRAKAGKLKPDDTQGGTYTVTNVGTFGSVFGTPIINQPQVGILALGAIRKVPAVIETPEGDFIGIRQKMFLSHSYDHRVVDGALGGSFVKRVAEYLEAFDVERDF